MFDFFCGAGIGAAGFNLAGYDIIDAIDVKDYAVDTYNRNIGNHARIADIRKIRDEDFAYADVFVGGFPCTPFSEAGKGDGVNDENNGDLGYHFYRAVKAAKPKAFIVENVKGITFKKHQAFFNDLITKFTEAGYRVSWKLTDCHEYGVPQTRDRVFLVGIRNDQGFYFEFPEPLPHVLRKTLKYAIYDIKDELGTGKIANHSEYYDDGFSSRYTSRNRQRQWDEPSFTVVATARQLPLYPEPANFDIRKLEEYDVPPPRRFTVRECLRIQSVPDWFSFSDDIPLLKQYERCSGIPSLIAYKLGAALSEQLNACSHVGKRWESDSEDEIGTFSLYTCEDCGEEITEYHEVG
jgi:DNA (cytosine-5)-methyltransferase 1